MSLLARFVRLGARAQLQSFAPARLAPALSRGLTVKSPKVPKADKPPKAPKLDKPPRKGLSAYNCYMRDALVDLKKEMPDAKQMDVMKAAAAHYAAIKENPAAMAKYAAAAAADAERAKAELATWNEAHTEGH
ncbi:hypothetical protein T492DRAFT_1150489 [Pavlovales sp. CCMP2436]|nr:hypothetical protein T492DRAFT_1150489 [Pavlovales sp. CCMP2436]|mmetsp:Transcript_4899/g.12577  ORF Transcript_4899/g.12577 Transcript_4899/m.12577 type:complete len:133 (+) Transcript_4899:37-435(+)